MKTVMGAEARALNSHEEYLIEHNIGNFVHFAF